LPLVGPGGQLKIEPKRIVSRRMVKKKNQSVMKVLVQWSNLAEDDSTWEEYPELRKQFPHFCLEDKTVIEGEAMSGLELYSGLGVVWKLFVLVNQAEDISLRRLWALSELGWEHKDNDEAHCELVIHVGEMQSTVEDRTGEDEQGR
jgi:Chromo (CHRromatin Organisation MOdifier) domain